MERRKGGETGVKNVQALPYDRIWEAEKAGLWSRKAVQTALKAAGKSAEDPDSKLRQEDSSVYVIDYLDGSRAVCCMFNGVTDQMSVAVEFEDDRPIIGQWFRMEMVCPFRHFEQLVRGLDHFFLYRKGTYAVGTHSIDNRNFDTCYP